MSDKQKYITDQVDRMWEVYMRGTTLNKEEGKYEINLVATTQLITAIQETEPEDRETVLNRFEAKVKQHGALEA